MIKTGQKRLRVRDRGAREKALITAAQKLFALRGYEAATTRDIAAEAGCAEGLIHRYFHGKAGLLRELIRAHMAAEISDINHLRPAPKLEQELLQLVALELDRMWAQRDFFNVIIPRAIVDPALGPLLRKSGLSRRSDIIVQRLKKFDECRKLPECELEALADFIGMIAFMCGFMRPAVLRDAHNSARELAVTLTKMLARPLNIAS